MKHYMRYALLAVAAVMLLLLAGCNPSGGKGADDGSSSGARAESSATAGKPQASSSSSSAGAKEEKLTVKVYYPNEDGTKLLAVKRQVTVGKNDKYTAAMASLLEGTKEKGQTTIIPKQAKLRSVKVENGIAKVDFSQEIVKNFVGGSTGETMLVGSVVDTLTEFPEVKKVQILVAGKPVETLGGHMDLSQPLARMKDLLK